MLEPLGRSANRAGRGASPAIGLVLALVASPVWGAPLSLTLLDHPDIGSGFIDVIYNAGSDEFVASGSALEIDDDGVGPALPITEGTFALNATIDESGNLIGGSLAIGGTVAALGFNPGTLLKGDLTAFGFRDGGGDPLEFLFEVAGGDAAELYGGLPGGVILSGSGFDGSFGVDFDNLTGGLGGSGSGVADTAAVPLPGTVLLMSSGLGGLCVLGRRLGGRASSHREARTAEEARGACVLCHLRAGCVGTLGIARTSGSG